jgi:hypothetical protein
MSALIAGAVAWAVTRRQGRTTRESWVLDRRYRVYEKIIEAATGLLDVHPWNV